MWIYNKKSPTHEFLSALAAQMHNVGHAAGPPRREIHHEDHTGAGCQHVARRPPNLRVPDVPTVRGLDLSSPQGVNSNGLFVRWRRSRAKNAMVMIA
jgi:hypothetical protein